MKRSFVPSLVVLLALVVVLPGCGRDETAAGDGTETIEPAKPLPEPTGTEAMTQTVDIEGGRSEAEGGGLTNPDSTTAATAAGTGGTTATTATTATATTTSTAAPPATNTR